MGSAERTQIAAQLTAQQHKQRPVAIVVSAMSKVTDLLLDTLRKAEAGDEGKGEEEQGSVGARVSSPAVGGRLVRRLR